MAINSIAEICEFINNCDCAPKDDVFRKWVVQLLCSIAGADDGIVTDVSCRIVTVAGAWGSIGDKITDIKTIDTSTVPPTIINEVFINETTNSIVTGIDETNSEPCASSDSNVNLTEVGGTAITLGQKAMVASVPVVLASNQSSIPVAATLTAETTKVIGTVNQGTSPWVVSGTVAFSNTTIAVTNAGTFATQATLQAGSAIVGKVGIDQTTPGTTNLVSLSAETTKVIGTVNQGTSPWVVSGTTSISGTVGVTQSTSPWVVSNGGTFATQATLQAGSAIAGKFGIDQTTPGTTNLVALTAETTKVIGTINIAAAQTLATVTTVGTVTTLTGTTTLTPGTGAANLGKAEDAAHVSGDTGVFILAVCENTPTASAADGDYIATKTNSLGCLFTEPANQVAGTPLSGSIAATSLTTSYSTLVTNSAKAGIITVYNGTDRDAQISFNASAAAATIPQGSSLVLDMAGMGRWVASNLSAKAIGSTGTTGTIYGSMLI